MLETLLAINWLFWLDLFGVLVFAISGTLIAIENRMDFFGAIVLAIVTAMGGGTIRDLVLGIEPVVWIKNVWYIWAAVGAALFTFFTSRFMRFNHKALLIADGLGLATFAVMGAQAALDLNMPATIVIITGVMTATFGGVIRDVLAGQIPLIFQRDVYATAVMLGVSIMVLMHEYVSDEPWVAVASAAFIFVLRFAVIQWNIRLPNWLTGQMEIKSR